MKAKKECGAHARTTGLPCRCKALNNGRCKLHGGMSTGPRTLQGKEKISKATKERMMNGQLEASKKGYKAWLESGGREHISSAQKNRHRRLKLTSMSYPTLIS